MAQISTSVAEQNHRQIPNGMESLDCTVSSHSSASGGIEDDTSLGAEDGIWVCRSWSVCRQLSWHCRDSRRIRDVCGRGCEQIADLAQRHLSASGSNTVSSL